MIEIKSSAKYDEPADTVFAVLTEIPRYPAWQADVDSATLADNGPAQDGARVRQVRTVMGLRAECELTISEFVPCERITLATGDGATPAIRQSYRIRPDGEGCYLEFTLILDGVPKLAEHLVRAQLSRQVPQMLDRLGTVAASR